jgi:GMP synthase (glutamine-hydrolysing)
MSLLVLRHEPFEHLGLFTAPLDTNKIPFVYHDLGDPMPFGEYRGVVVLGGPMSANDPLPGLADELALIERALDRGVPLLGICLGSQLIAKALGARVYRNVTLEIGWEPVHLTDAGRGDPIFQGIESPATFFHWHGDTFDLPPGAEWLAWSEKTRHQAYRAGSNVYGLQFHPEVTAGMIEDWSREPVNCGDVATLAELARRIIENWLTSSGLLD